ncbi:hypothetical protein BX666DRAFT_1980501, partial [Dichotomocladium elegans]
MNRKYSSCFSNVSFLDVHINTIPAAMSNLPTILFICHTLVTQTIMSSIKLYQTISGSQSFLLKYLLS